MFNHSVNNIKLRSSKNCKLMIIKTIASKIHSNTCRRNNQPASFTQDRLLCKLNYYSTNMWFRKHVHIFVYQQLDSFSKNAVGNKTSPSLYSKYHHLILAMILLLCAEMMTETKQNTLSGKTEELVSAI